MGPQGYSATDIQAHLYNSFLEGKTADVSLHVRGSWEAVYRLHRVVLIQAVSILVFFVDIQSETCGQGFFRSLFAGGFLESSPKLSSHYAGPEEVDVTFADPNITRPGE